MKKMNHNQGRISESELLIELGSLRDEVAAPAEFRAQILRKLGEERGLAWQPKAPSLWKKLLDALATPSFVPALAGLLVLLLGLSWTLIHLAPALPSPSLSPAPRAGQEKAAPLELAQGSKAHSSKIPSKISLPARESVLAQAPQTLTIVGGEEHSLPLAQGAQAPLSASVQTSFSGQNPPTPVNQSSEMMLPAAGNGPGGKPSPQAQMSPVFSQIRNNKIHPQEGEYSQLVFKLQNPGSVSVQVYNRMGRLVRTLGDGYFAPGENSLNWDGRDGSGQVCPSGIYILRIVTPEYAENQKVVLIN